jgi:hypothetical protein
MKSACATAQEEFWAGEFGTEYVRRNPAGVHLAANFALLERALRRAGEIADCIEFGANVGINMRALQMLRPRLTQHAVEHPQDDVTWFLMEKRSLQNGGSHAP